LPDLTAPSSPPASPHRFWLCFRKLDKKLQGKIDLKTYYAGLTEKRSIFGDGLFELLNIRHRGKISFGEWLHVVTTYCLFEKEDILKYCFFVFDRDKNGYVEQDEFTIIINVLYHIVPPDGPRGNTKVAMFQLKEWWYQEDGRVDFPEVRFFNKQYPALLYPAYRLQYNMMLTTMGEEWWNGRKALLQDIREDKVKAEELKRAKKEARKEKMRQRKIRKKMGILRYYCCPFLRSAYDKLYPKEPPVVEHKESAAERKERLRMERERLKRIEEIAMKNPETEEWQKYLEKKKTMKITFEKNGPPKERTSAMERRERLEARRDRNRRVKGNG